MTFAHIIQTLRPNISHMSNPATLLAEILATWDVPKGEQPEARRGINSKGSREFWRDHGRVVELLLEIERALSGLELAGNNVEHYWNAVPQWYRAVFAFTTPWQSSVPADRLVLERPYLDMLRGLGTLLDVAQSSPPLLPDSIEGLRTAIEEVEDLIRVSTDLDKDVRLYMLSLVWDAKRCLDEIEIFGSAKPRRVVFELSGVMQSYAVQLHETSPEAARTWFQKARSLVSNLFVAAGSKAIEAGAEQIVKGMLEQ